MTRQYRKKPNAKTAGITLPIPPGLLEKLREYARALELTPTAAARAIIAEKIGYVDGRKP